jgi:S-adenosylmethionine:tRNA ribosyltransferase-isomerase
MRIDEFSFDLPDELIAQEPLAERAGSRMLVVDRAAQTFSDDSFTHFSDRLSPSDILVVNNTKVFPARLYGKTETGAAVEAFLVSELADGSWEVLAKPGRRLKQGKTIIFSEDLSAEVVERKEDGKVILRFSTVGDLSNVIDRIGQTPLPPYIKRERAAIDTDRERYQTVYAAERGAIAAPTAGLHFSPEILEAIRAKGVEIAELTLHVGYGTFEPVRVDDVNDHRVMAERYEISEATAATLNSARADGRRIVAIGTTTTRALESNMTAFGTFTPGRHSAELTITPGYDFEAVGALLTNFHLPKSSLLVLTSVFGGRELIMKAYAHAVRERYRFYSYGDCMFIS